MTKPPPAYLWAFIGLVSMVDGPDCCATATQRYAEQNFFRRAILPCQGNLFTRWGNPFAGLVQGCADSIGLSAILSLAGKERLPLPFTKALRAFSSCTEFR